MRPMIDHLVLATDDLERTVAQLASDWGVTPTPGGVHVGHGTRNELVGIGNGAYLEIIGPDLAQGDHDGGRPFGVDEQRGAALVAWCARPTDDIETAAEAALAHGHDVGEIVSMSRRRPDGVLLQWRLTFAPRRAEGTQHAALVPFLIDWLDSEHPTDSLRHPVELLELQLQTTEPDRVRAVIDAIGGDPRITVQNSEGDSMLARLRTPAGDVTLSG